MRKQLSKMRVGFMLFHGMCLCVLLAVCACLFSLLSVRQLVRDDLSRLDATAEFLSKQLSNEILFHKQDARVEEKVDASVIEGDLSQEEYVRLKKLRGELEGGEEVVVDGYKLNATYITDTLFERVLKMSRYWAFIVKEDGSFVVPRNSLNVDHDQWPRYQNTLLYQMKKQSDGWIHYPKKKEWEIQKSNNAIRYLPIPEIGWILAVESKQRSGLEQFYRILNLDFYKGLLAVVLVYMLILRSSLSGLMRRTERLIIKTWEKRQINLNVEKKPVRSILRRRSNYLKVMRNQYQKDKSFAKKIAKEEALMAPSLDEGVELDRQSPAVDKQALFDEWLAQLSEQQKSIIQENVGDDEVLEEKKALIESRKENSVVKNAEFERNKSLKPRDLEEVKLPLLKKLLSEMRG